MSVADPDAPTSPGGRPDPGGRPREDTPRRALSSRIRAWWRRTRRPDRRLAEVESNALALLALITGVAVGLAAVGFQELIDALSTFFRGSFTDWFAFLGRFRVAVAPVAGALLAGPLIFRLAREARGHGVPEVMEAVAIRSGRIRPRVAGVKSLASALTIGSGGSAGREGPVVQIGAALGSSIAKVSRSSPRRMRLLVASGSAAGIAAVFNAPLAGVFFALEVVLQRFSTRGFATVVLSAVTASAIWRAFNGNEPVLHVPLFGLEHGAELGLYFLLGVVAAIVAIAFVSVLDALEVTFDRLRIVPDLKPAVGAVAVGLLGVGSTSLLGTGLEGINDALAGEIGWEVMLLLLGGKLVATSFTLGSGASGGVFSPSLFLGAMLGASFGNGVHSVLGGLAGPVGAYSMVGMAAVFAAAAQAPITAILIVFEMTNDYLIMLPLMLACVTSAFVYRTFKRGSVYTVKLARRGIELVQGRERHLLEATSVMRAVDREHPRIATTATVRDAMAELQHTNGEAVLVTTEDGRYEGVVFNDDLESEEADASIEACLRRDVPTGTVRDSLDSALRKIAPRDLEVLPVVDVNGQALGAATRQRLMRSYWNTLSELERLPEDERAPG